VRTLSTAEIRNVRHEREWVNPEKWMARFCFYHCYSYCLFFIIELFLLLNYFHWYSIYQKGAKKCGSMSAPAPYPKMGMVDNVDM
jgi:hypothetical protein